MLHSKYGTTTIDGKRGGSTVCDVPRMKLSRWATETPDAVVVSVQAGDSARSLLCRALAPVWARVPGVADAG